MVCKTINRWLVCFVFVLSVAVVHAQSADEDDAPRPRPTPDIQKKTDEITNIARQIGPWENQHQLLSEATDHIFAQQGWNSEPDQFARAVVQDVGRIPPWEPQKRQQVFMQHLQQRFSLSHDQAAQFSQDFQREGMKLAFKHFKDVAPVAMEAINTRLRNEPFTPDQVSAWTKRLRPVMDDSLDVVERVTSKLRQTMDPQQRRQLDEDLRALRRRHQDMMRMVERWQNGLWTPADWGLQSDPIHAGEMARYAAQDAEKDALVEAAMARRPDEGAIAREESEWDKYVKWFCNTYYCDERQRTTAAAILTGAKKEAVAYRAARADRIEKIQADLLHTQDAARRKTLAADLDSAYAPITDTFERMKKRLYEEVLTTEQRLKYTPSSSKSPEK